MGRYYNGDIEGKFWFGLQASNSADRFGVFGQVPEYIEYYFEEDDKQNVESELNRIKKSLGGQLQLIDDFFEKNNSYTDDMLIGSGIDINNLSDYADYRLGQKILDCLNENGSCQFTGEL
jgi:hypothetical protein